VPELPAALAWLQPMLDKLLAKDPDDRYSSAGELLDDIERVSGTTTSVSSDATVTQKSVLPSAKPALSGKLQKIGKKKGMVAVAAAALIVLTTVVTWKLLPEPAPEIAPVDEATAQEIEKLLETAGIFVEMDDLIDAGPTNAVNMYMRILEKQKGNPAATQGMKSALEQILVDIKSLIDAGDKQAAQNLIQLSEYYFPDNKKLAGLRKQAGL